MFATNHQIGIGHIQLAPDLAAGIDKWPPHAQHIVVVIGIQSRQRHLPQPKMTQFIARAQIHLRVGFAHVSETTIHANIRADALGWHPHPRDHCTQGRIHHPLIRQITLDHQTARIGFELFGFVQVQAQAKCVPLLGNFAVRIIVLHNQPATGHVPRHPVVYPFNTPITAIHQANVLDGGTQRIIYGQIGIGRFGLILLRGSAPLFAVGGGFSAAGNGVIHSGCRLSRTAEEIGNCVKNTHNHSSFSTVTVTSRQPSINPASCKSLIKFFAGVEPKCVSQSALLCLARAICAAVSGGNGRLVCGVAGRFSTARVSRLY